MSYTLLDAIRDEIKFQQEQVELAENSTPKRVIAIGIHDEIKRAFSRILERYEDGFEHYIGIKNGNPAIQRRQTTKHLERDFESVKEAKDNLDTVIGLVKEKKNDSV